MGNLNSSEGAPRNSLKGIVSRRTAIKGLLTAGAAAAGLLVAASSNEKSKQNNVEPTKVPTIDPKKIKTF